ncbi:MAG: hypothetical protein ACLR8Y_14405 [Alistipes indistinctus]
MGSDDTQTIRIDAGEKVGKFTPGKRSTASSASTVRSTKSGSTKLLSQWEEQAKAQAEAQHGTAGSSCESDQKARGGTPVQQRRRANLRISASASPSAEAKEGGNCLLRFCSGYGRQLHEILLSDAIRKIRFFFADWSRCHPPRVIFTSSAGGADLRDIRASCSTTSATLTPNTTSPQRVPHRVCRNPARDGTKAYVLSLLGPLNETDNYTKHCFPSASQVRSFPQRRIVVGNRYRKRRALYESVRKRPLWSGLNRLHCNPGRWWTTFSDIFAFSLILITLTGLVMLKGPKGFWGRGGIEFLAGILIPIAFLVFM